MKSSRLNETIKAIYPKEINFVHNTAQKRIALEVLEVQIPFVS